MGYTSKRYKGRQHAWNINTLVRRDGAVCGICHEDFTSKHEITLDHKIALARGGDDKITNLQLAHEKCNHDKGTMTPEEWAEFQAH